MTAEPSAEQAEKVTWERPILHARVALGDEEVLDVINVHLKSKLPAEVPGQKPAGAFAPWKTASGCPSVADKV